ncbi:RsmE family RNA methyltransferase [Facklamia miroungae]|uniref:Ribosomal RNA small subunit methyltransferase E n=1 Tax=Facklamia miroungae TaxID=120956 RepID=A0A1G7QZ45_9LACT|nr:RsmE family RNA methyltransferase [Facklamia miroungae]NKZ29118.1 16S rRNA (uracil(1498)-N(3))-methyltransferase [Facklamia miroungae]SDG03781.1 16S rRNA (uracil1498-N3)-methyltransferase [Facklamia miroungae]
MHQYFIKDQNQILEPGHRVYLNQADSHHLINVLRARHNKQLLVVHNHKKYLAKYIEKQNDLALLEVSYEVSDKQSQTELPVEVVVACGLSKNDKIDTIVQKGTECGMSFFQPLALQRDVVKWDHSKAGKKIVRLQKIADSAAEQSKRLKQVKIKDLMNLKEFVAQYQDFDFKLVAFEEKAKDGEHHLLAKIMQKLIKNQKVVMLFGSEGGLDQEEVDFLIEHGFQACSLGPRILRAETAPIYLLSVISYVTEIEKEFENEVK